MCIKTATPKLTINEVHITTELRPFVHSLDEDYTLGDAVMTLTCDQYAADAVPTLMIDLIHELSFGATLYDIVVYHETMRGVRRRSAARTEKMMLNMLDLPKYLPTKEWQLHADVEDDFEGGKVCFLRDTHQGSHAPLEM